MAPVVRLVLFDIDGTLIRTGGAGVKAFERTFDTVFGLKQATREVSFAGRTDTSLVRECLEKHGIPHTDEARGQFFDTYPFWLDHMLGRLPGALCPGAASFLERLAGLAHPPLIGLLTGNIQLGAELKLRHYGLWDSFEMGGFGDDSEDRSQIARVAKKRAERMLGTGLRGREIVVIGDTPSDIACGKAIDAKTLAVGTGGFTAGALAENSPTWALNDLTEIEPSEMLGA